MASPCGCHRTRLLRRADEFDTRCEEFAAKGCVVYATARRLASLDGFTHEAVNKLELDVTEDGSVQAAVRTVIEREGQIDILVNNAGMSNSGMYS